MLPDGYHYLPPGKLAAVVTYLEMTERPPGAGRTAAGAWRVRKVERPDVNWYRELFRKVGEDWLWFSRLRLSHEELAAIVHDERVDVFALEHEGEDQGLLELDRRRFPEIELAFLGVTADLLGRGAGRALMELAIAEAWRHEPEKLTVHTCTLDHPKALGFYLKCGFRAVQRAIEISADPRLTGEARRTAAPRIPLL
jgi:GNAT superfamily N-acetyltransferase